MTNHKENETDDMDDFAHNADHVILQQRPLRGMLIIHIAWITALIFLIWATITEVDELVKADAKVVPSSSLQVLQSLDGGVVLQILVKEGQAVKAGQPMLQIDNTRFTAAVRESQAQNIALAARAERLNALLENRAFKLPENSSADDILVYHQEQRYFDNARFELKSQTSIANQQVIQRQQELVEASAKRNQAKKMLASVSRELDMTQSLLSTGAVSEVELIRLERDVTRFSGELAQSIAQIARFEASINEGNRKIESVGLEFRNNVSKDLSETMARLNSISQSSVGLQDKVTQSVIRSPMNGFVKRLFVNTVGGVVTPGRDLVEVVPSEDNLVLEAKVQTRDIAFLHVGQPALVKFNAYDFSTYGGMDAKLLSIGADSITDEKGNVYFLVKLATLKPELKKGLPIIPGMQAEVDIHTGSKSVLSYLLKPLLRARQVALTER
jgi:adhesin transport system membrane fusion protein